MFVGSGLSANMGLNATSGAEAGLADILSIMRRACQVIGTVGTPGGGGAGGGVDANSVATVVVSALRADLNEVKSNTKQALDLLRQRPGGTPAPMPPGTPGSGVNPTTGGSGVEGSTAPVATGTTRYAAIDSGLNQLAQSRQILDARAKANSSPSTTLTVRTSTDR